MHMSFVARALERSVFCASTCRGSIAKAIPTNAEKIKARRRRLAVRRDFKSSGVKTPEETRAFMSRLMVRLRSPQEPRPVKRFAFFRRCLSIVFRELRSGRNGRARGLHSVSAGDRGTFRGRRQDHHGLAV